MDLKQERAAGAQALKQLLAPVQSLLLIAQLLAIISALLAIVPYYALVKLGVALLDSQGAAEPAVTAAITLVIIGFTARLGVYFLALLLAHYADYRLGAKIRGDMIAHVSRLPLQWFSATNAGRVRKILHDDVTQIHYLVAHKPVDFTVAMFMPLGMVIFAFTVDWRLGLLTLATLPLYVAAMAWMMRDMGEKTVEMDARLGVVSSTMVEFVTGITVVKAFGKVGQAHGRYQKAADAFMKFYLRWVGPQLRGSAIAYASIAIPVVLLVNLGGGYLLGAPLADVLTTTLIALMVPGAVETVGSATWQSQIAGAAALRIVGLLQEPVLADGHSAGHSADLTDLTVRFEDVSFAYGDTKVVEHFNLELKPGTVTALVGPSGSGKSTIATLLARFNDPDSGRITIGGRDLRDFSTAELYNTVGFVLQDPQLLDMSIRDNIALGKPDATDEEVIAAAKAAHIHDEIVDYNATQQLSGGQQQRIAIARALLLDTPILILDEATAFADPESEAQIQQALNTLVQGRTVLVIAHRPECLKGATIVEITPCSAQS